MVKFEDVMMVDRHHRHRDRDDYSDGDSANDDDSLGFSDEQSDSSDDSSTDGSSVQVAKEDIKLMNIVRAIVILILLTVAFVTGESVFVVATIAEQENFRTGYAEAATTLIDSFYETLDRRLWVTSGLSSSLAATAMQHDDDMSWPNVTFEGFEARCSAPRHVTQATMITFDPLIRYQNRAQWEAYAVRAFSSSIDPRFVDPINAGGSPGGSDSGDYVTYFPTNRSVEQGIYRFDRGRAKDEGDSFSMMFPMWQTAPNLMRYSQSNGLIGVLFNGASNLVRQAALDRMVLRDGGILSQFLYQDSDGSDFASYNTPAASIYYPIRDHADRSAARNVVGAVNVELQWHTFLTDVLHAVNDPLYVVVENECDGNFTYLVENVNATFMGYGDLHDTAVDGYTPTNSSYQTFAAIFDPHGKVPIVAGDGDGDGDGDDGSDAAGHCNYRLSIFASSQFKKNFLTTKPDIYRAMVLAIFLSMVAVFIVYDCLVERRQNRVVDAAARSDAIVRSLFPSNVRDRLYENAKKKEGEKNAAHNALNNNHRTVDWEHNLEFDEDKTGLKVETPKNRLRNFMSSSPADQAAQDMEHEAGMAGAGGVGVMGMEPIADLFPHATVMFGDIAGFTAWSSEREPQQVFALLETLFRAMDKAAKRFQVFKVETVGDCYVAATGVPDPQKDHAEIMIRFARCCMVRVNELTKRLETQLGPGTGDLAMRFGCHSGPVTAGVLRGQKARFQLFGDTMNMASRMESSGLKNRIHLSQETVDILAAAGHHNWVVPRKDKVTLKGKGSLQTYWLVVGTSTDSISSNDSGEVTMAAAAATGAAGSTMNQMVDIMGGGGGPDQKNQTLASIWAGTELEMVLGQSPINDRVGPMIDWNVEVLISMLKRIVAQRIVSGIGSGASNHLSSSVEKKVAGGGLGGGGGGGKNGGRGLVLDEIEMVITMPEFDVDLANKALKEQVDLIPAVREELRDYVACIASGYRRNSFHNFDHASHVILSANKLIKRICTPDEVGPHQKTNFTTVDLHAHTYGIGTDPLTHFAVVFSALIHDVGHTGVPNGQVAKEDPDLASKYVNKSIAEQRSVDIAWDLLLLPHFKNLRACIYQTREDCQRFRRLVVNSVMATDIFDKELKQLRNSRWDLAFHSNTDNQNKTAAMTKEDSHRKATIVIEHIIQASDVAHTMQHWNIYQKWNERLFKEMYFAFLCGRSEKDPSLGWYGGEIWFFDNYVIPLAGKLKECEIFGVSSDEYLNYAVNNRKEWEQKGKDVVASMKERADKEAVKLGFLKMENIEELPDEEEDQSAVTMGSSKVSQQTTTTSSQGEEEGEEDHSSEKGHITGEATQEKPGSADGRKQESAPVVSSGTTPATTTDEDSDVDVESAATTESSSTDEGDDDDDDEGKSKDDDNSAGAADDNTRTIVVPPGKLGIVIDTTLEGPVIHSVDDASPLKGLVEYSDVIVSIDGVETVGMSAPAITALLRTLADQPKTFLVRRTNQ